MNIKLTLATIVLAVASFAAQATAVYVPNTKALRKESTRVAFIRNTACPATGKHAFPCKGYIIDHIVPLCAGGKDAIENMQWQTTADSYKKDVLERKQCAALKKAVK
jgi:hypothetical protein